jgi:hypothetical protein
VRSSLSLADLADGGRPGSGDGKGKHYGNEDGRLDRRKSPRSEHLDNSMPLPESLRFPK